MFEEIFRNMVKCARNHPFAETSFHWLTRYEALHISFFSGLTSSDGEYLSTWMFLYLCLQMVSKKNLPLQNVLVV